VLLRAALTPRFPELDERGKVVQRVRVWHDHDAPVTLTRVVRRVHHVDGTDDGDERIAPGVLFGGATIAGRAGLDATLELADRDVFSIEYVLEGTTGDGLPAQGGFSIMRPPERPTADNSQPVVDAALRARIVRARELLKREYVTDEDLWKLEREGAFTDLPPTGETPEPAAGAPKGPPAIAPPRPR
jgi:hypothetical protein